MKPARYRVRWTEAELEDLDALYPHEYTWSIAILLDRSERSIYELATRRGLRKTPEFLSKAGRLRATPDHPMRVTQFQKGQRPANAGLRRPGWAPGRMAETQFKKGRPPHEAHNYKPIGSVRISHDGVLERKISDDLTTYPAGRWAPVHRLVWESANGPVPRGQIVVFRPGRRTTDEAGITVDALELLTWAENMRRNSYHTRYPKEIGLLIQTRAVLSRAINRRSQELTP